MSVFCGTWFRRLVGLLRHVCVFCCCNGVCVGGWGGGVDPGYQCNVNISTFSDVLHSMKPSTVGSSTSRRILVGSRDLDYLDEMKESKHPFNLYSVFLWLGVVPALIRLFYKITIHLSIHFLYLLYAHVDRGVCGSLSQLSKGRGDTG